MSDDTVLCPDCGWTGQPDALDEAGAGEGDDDRLCPVCSTDIEFVD
jgi:rubredoxin